MIIIDNSGLQSHIMYALSDSHMHKILQSTSLSVKSVTEIIREQEFRTNHALIGGIFGTAMIAALGTWMVCELLEAIAITPTEDGEYSIKTIDSISFVVMAGFGIFLIGRFFWLRSIMPIEPKYVRS